MQIYGDYSYKPKEYVPPVHMVVDLADLEKEDAELEARNKELLIELEKIQKKSVIRGEVDQ